jgi:hypothetical protein
MRICPKKATAALNLLAIAAVVWLYCLDKIVADPVAAMPDRPSPLQAPDSVVPNRPVDRLEAGINMTNISLPAPPPASAAMPSPPAAVSQSPTSKQTFAEPTPAPTPDPTPDPTLGAEPTLVPLVPQPAQDTTAPIMPIIAKPIHMRPAKLNQVAVPPLTVSPVQPTPTALAPLAVPAPAKPMTAPALRPMAVVPPQQTPLLQSPRPQTLLSQTGAPQVTPLQDLHIRQANLLKGQQTLDMVANKGGLDMEIFWPDTARQSAYLYDVMTRCFGMRSAVLNRAGEMVSTAGKGQANHAGLSPLIRQLKQPASRGEADVIAKIVAQHHVRGAYTPVRIFTKSVDARLVDGIAQLTGKAIGPNSVLRADYVIDQGRVFVANITHDGVRAAGRVLLVDGGC